MHAVHHVIFSGDNDDAGNPKQQPALVLGPTPMTGGSIGLLLVWQGSEGWAEKRDVPHGSETQGYTWH